MFKRQNRFLSSLIIMVLLLVGCANAIEKPSETLAVEVTATPTPAPTPVEPTAKPITENVIIKVNQTNYSNVLSDGNHYTSKKIKSTQKLSVDSAQAFSGIYVEWGQAPAPYTISWDGGSVECGSEYFIHDYIRLPNPVYQITFNFTEEAPQTVCDLQIFTEGTAPEGVQDWLPPCTQADILVFPTHSDDDVFFFGPMIAYYCIERQLAVQTAFMVNHKSQPERAHERLNGLWEMGVRHYPILGEAPDAGKGSLDSGLTYYNKHSDIYGWQIEQIRRFKPFVILGHDLNGEYGNKGHKVNAYYLTQTVPDAADPTKHPESANIHGVWNTPKMYLHFYEENSWEFDVETIMKNDPQNRTPLEVANIALDCHVSQNGTGLSVSYTKQNPKWNCRPFGLYRTLVGYDTKADIMENINPNDWR